MALFLRAALGAAMIALVPVVALAQGASAPASAPAAAAVEAGKAGDGDATDANEGGGRRLAVCRADMEKYCPGTSRGARRTCMTENAAKLSPECSAAFADVEAKAKAMRDACSADVTAHCAAAGKGEGGRGIVTCLRENKAKVTPTCATAMEARYARN